MQDNPLKPGGEPPKPAGVMDIVVLWAMVTLFGVVWVAMVWAGKTTGRPQGATMTDKYSPVPTFSVTEPMASVLLGAGAAIVLVGVLGGIRAASLACRRTTGTGSPPPTPTSRVCEACGRAVAPEFHFCPHCGAKT